MKKRLYVAYGSNLNLKQMSHRCPTAKVYGKGKLKRYRLLFRGSKNNAYLTIESKKMVYIMTDKIKDRISLNMPSKNYLAAVKEGYREFGFDLKYLKEALDISKNNESQGHSLPCKGF